MTKRAIIIWEIVKVQRPLAGNDPAAPWLIYDKARKRSQTLPEKDVQARVRDEMGEDAKAFFEASWAGDRLGWALGPRVKNQEW